MLKSRLTTPAANPGASAPWMSLVPGRAMDVMTNFPSGET